MTGQPAVLLDTCAAIWLVNASPLCAAVTGDIQQTGQSGGVYVSTPSAWEIGLLSRPRPNRIALQFLPDPKSWFARLLGLPGINEAPITAAIALDSSHLPGNLHPDPADRRIIAYAGAGFVKVIPC
jgi:PIN domain nuclease of toxin-antitoxin system